MSDTSLRARGTSEIVDAAFALFRRHALQYLAVSAIASAPGLIISLILSSTPPATVDDVWRMLPGLIVTAFSFFLVSAVISRMGSDVYLGAEPDLAATVRDVLKKLPTLIGVTIVSSLIMVIGFILFIVPGLYAAVALFAVATVVVIEDKGVSGAISRSYRLTKGRKMHVFATLMLVWIIYLIFSIGFSMGAAATGSTVVQMITSTFFSVLAYPIMNLVSMVLYYDLRIRAEGFDLEHMAQSLGSSQTATPMGASPA